MISFGLLWEFLDREVDEGTPSRTHAYRQALSRPCLALHICLVPVHPLIQGLGECRKE